MPSLPHGGSVANVQAIEKVGMSDTIWPFNRELFDGLLDSVSATFDEITHDEVAGTIESVVTMDADKCLLIRRTLRLFRSDLVHQFDKTGHLRVCRWDFRYCRELVVPDPFSETFGVVHRIRMTYINNIFNYVAPEES